MPSGYPKSGINKGWFTSEKSKGNKYREGIPAWNKGKNWSEDFKKKVSLGVKKYFENNPDVVRGLSKKRRKTALENGNGKWMKGKKLSEETKKKIGNSNRGENNWNWKGGIKVRGKSTLNTTDYRIWRMSVLKRDNFKYKISNPDCKGQLQTHHILRWAEHPELRYEVNNGITLCRFHHPLKKIDEIKLSPYFKELVASSDSNR